MGFELALHSPDCPGRTGTDFSRRASDVYAPRLNVCPNERICTDHGAFANLDPRKDDGVRTDDGVSAQDYA